MTRRVLLFAPFFRDRNVERLNAIAAAGTEFDIAWGKFCETWNKLAKDWEHVDRTQELLAAWEPLSQLFRKIEEAYKDWAKELGK